MPRIHSDNFVLINLEGRDSFVFEFFPNEIQGTDRANYEQQDTTIGMKQLFYANRDPRRLSAPELILGARADAPIGEEIDALRALQNELPKTGAPPALLAAYGSRQLRCVLEEITITENFFTPEGDPLRARVSLNLIELQEEGTAVDVNIHEVDDIDSRRDIGG
jgi:hypothetical protein